MVNTLTYERLHEVLHYDPDSGVFTWKIDIYRNKLAGKKAGCKNGRGYLLIKLGKKIYLAHRLAWFYTHGYLPEHWIDHINHICDDNRIDNLREVSNQCNIRNSKHYITNTSGVKGVSWYTAYGQWQPQIKINNKSKFLGRYDDFDEAVCVRLAAEQCVNWSGCDSTSGAYLYVKQNIQEKKQ